MTIAKLEPLTKKQMRAACKAEYPETKRKLKQGLGHAPMFYYVLQVNQLNPKDQKIVEKGLALCTTPNDCQKLISKEAGWAYRDISLVKDFQCGLLMYKGLAVALYFKRQVCKIEPEPTDPVPTGALEDLEDVWARLDLFSESPRQLVNTLKEEILRQEREIISLNQQLKAAQIVQAVAASKQIPPAKKQRK